jgi:hypothetical protein
VLTREGKKNEAWKPGLRPVEALLSVLCLDTWIEEAAKAKGLRVWSDAPLL